VLEVDPAYGRPTLVRSYNDVARYNDDVCVELSYANLTGSVLSLDAVSEAKLTDCNGGQAQTLAVERLWYDDLPWGNVGAGLYSSGMVERYDLSTGTFIDAFVTSSVLERDPHGNPVAIEQVRESDGGTRVTGLEYDEFGVAVVAQSVIASGVEADMALEIHRDTLSLAPTSVIDANGVQRRTRYDLYERPQFTSLYDPVAGQEWLLGGNEYSDPGSPAGHHVVQRRYRSWVEVDPFTIVPPDATSVATTTYFDDFGRPSRRVTDLGADYGDAQVVVGDAVLDGVGRPVFVPDPFEQGADPAEQYGTTYVYLPDGRIDCTIRGQGQQTPTTETDVSSDVYPTCHTYAVRSGEAVVEVKGPNENLSGSPQYGHYDTTRYTATGLPVATSRARIAGAEVLLDLETFTYDRLGHVAQVTRHLNLPIPPVTWSFTHDSAGHVLTADEPGTATRSFRYDEWGQRIESSWMELEGSLFVSHGTRQEYDGLGRMTRSYATRFGTLDTDAPVQRYWYDAHSGTELQPEDAFLVGKLSHVDSSDSRVANYLAYDAFGRVISEAWHDKDADETYWQRQLFSPDGAPEYLVFSLADAPGKSEGAHYLYDSAGRLRTVEWSGVGGEAFPIFDVGNIDPFGRSLSITYGNGVVESFKYRPDRRRELQSVGITGSSWSRFRAYAPPDPAGRAVFDVESVATCPPEWGCTPLISATSVSYDARNRLASVVRTGAGAPRNDEFAYDELGNLTSTMDHVAGVLREFEPDPTDRDRVARAADAGAPAGATHAYDARGSVSSIVDPSTGNVRNFGYDAAGRLASLQLEASDGKPLAEGAIRYDAMGRVAAVDVLEASTERSERLFGALIQERTVDGERRFERRIPGPDGRVAVRRGPPGDGTWIYPVGDPTGTRFTTNAGGDVVQSISYSPYGEVTSDTGVPGSDDHWTHLWNGGDLLRPFDVTMLGARAYDARNGRFLQRDPIVLATSATDANPYTFAGGDPVNFVDPSGMTPGPVDCGMNCTVDGILAAWAARGAIALLGELDLFGGSGADGSGPDPVADHARRANALAAAASADAARLTVQLAWSVAQTLPSASARMSPTGTFQAIRSPLEEVACQLSNCDAEWVDALPTVSSLKAAGTAFGFFQSSRDSALTCARTGACDAGPHLYAAMAHGNEALAYTQLAAAETVLSVWTPGGSGMTGRGGRPARITPGSLPAAEERSLLQTLSHIDASTTPRGRLARNWGAPFRNRAGDLPGGRGSASPYVEYRVAPTSGRAAGTLRVVVDRQTGEMFFTWTHYGDTGSPPFVQIR
jgi:RHS repeat-associated protein